MTINIQQLTTNNTNDGGPVISGSNMAWQTTGGSDGGTDTEVVFYDGTTAKQLTVNTTAENIIVISGSNVAWNGQGGSDGGSDNEVFYYDGTTTKQLTTNTTGDNTPVISGSNIVWTGTRGSDGGTDTEVFHYDGTTTKQLTVNTTADNSPAISGSNVVWTGAGGSDGGTDTEIFYYDGTTTKQLTVNTTADTTSAISGRNVVWLGAGGSDGGTDTEVFYYDGTTTKQLTVNTTADNTPRISGSNVAWNGAGGSDGGTDNEVFYYDGTSVIQITVNNNSDSFPSIFDSNVAWAGAGGSDGGADNEIFLAEIITNSPPTDISVSNSSIAENTPAPALVGTLSSSDPDTGDTFTYSLVSGTGGEDNSAFSISGDQLLASNSFNFENQSTYSIRVQTTDSQGATFEKVLGINVTDVDESGSLSVSDVSVTEGNSLTTAANFVVSLSEASSSYVRVEVNTSNYIAAGSDYQAVSTTVTFNPGETSQTVSVAILGDTTIEPNERFLVKLANPVGGILDNSIGVGTIINNDETRPTINITSDTVTEGDSGTKEVEFTVTLSALSSQPISFNYSTINYSAMAGTDFEAIPTTALTFNPGETTKTISVGILGDTTKETNEKFLLNLTTPNNPSFNNRVLGVGTILNDDGVFSPPLISVTDGSIEEGDSGSTNLNFTVSLSQSSASSVRFNYVTEHGSAKDVSDYQGIPTTSLTFNPGETTKTISVAINGDTTIEGTERFFLNLSGAQGGNLYDRIATVTIFDNDTLPSINITDSTVTEGNSGRTDSNFVVSLSQATTKTVTVAYNTTGGTASSAQNSDYIGVISATLTFNPGETQKTISVKVNGDSLIETTERFFLNLSSSVNGTFENRLGVGTILNDDLTSPSIPFSNKLTLESEINATAFPSSKGSYTSFLSESDRLFDNQLAIIPIPSDF